MLIFGMGNLGKSSLAARIANRMPKHQTVVAYERYDALAIFERLVAALPGSERAVWKRSWREQIASGGATLGDALEEMLEGPFDRKPILLIIDDLEQILKTPKPDQMATPVKDTPRMVIQKERTPAWAIALCRAVYAQGLSLRRTALVLAQMGVRISHVAVWYRILSFSNNWTMWNDSLPDTIVVDETRVKLDGRPCWI